MMKHLLNPFQLHETGINVQDACLQHLKIEDRSLNSHMITTPNKQLIIPLHLNGIFSSFTVHKPTKHELDSNLEFHIMTNDSPQWEPNDNQYALDDKGICSDINLILIPTRAKCKVHDTPGRISYSVTKSRTTYQLQFSNEILCSHPAPSKGDSIPRIDSQEVENWH